MPEKPRKVHILTGAREVLHSGARGRAVTLCGIRTEQAPDASEEPTCGQCLRRHHAQQRSQQQCATCGDPIAYTLARWTHIAQPHGPRGWDHPATLGGADA